LFLTKIDLTTQLYFGWLITAPLARDWLLTQAGQ